jgi:hypothetical protein
MSYRQTAGTLPRQAESPDVARRRSVLHRFDRRTWRRIATRTPGLPAAGPCRPQAPNAAGTFPPSVPQRTWACLLNRGPTADAEPSTSARPALPNLTPAEG